MGEVMQPAHRQPRLRFQSGLGLDSCAAHIRMSGCVPALKQTFLPPYASPNPAPGFECRMKNVECRSSGQSERRLAEISGQKSLPPALKAEGRRQNAEVRPQVWGSRQTFAYFAYFAVISSPPCFGIEPKPIPRNPVHPVNSLPPRGFGIKTKPRERGVPGTPQFAHLGFAIGSKLSVIELRGGLCLSTASESMNDQCINVLLVEDEPVCAALVEEMLASGKASPFAVTRVKRLSEALERVGQDRFDVALLDLALPDASGLLTYTDLHARAPALPIIVLTGCDDEELALQAVREGAQDYLVKGQWDGRMLGRVIRYAIERKRASEALRRSEEFFRLISENVNDLITVIDKEGRRLYKSPSYQRLRGEAGRLAGSDSFEAASSSPSSPREERVGRGPRRGESNKNAPPLPSPLLHPME